MNNLSNIFKGLDLTSVSSSDLDDISNNVIKTMNIPHTQVDEDGFSFTNEITLEEKKEVGRIFDVIDGEDDILLLKAINTEYLSRVEFEIQVRNKN